MIALPPPPRDLDKDYVGLWGGPLDGYVYHIPDNPFFVLGTWFWNDRTLGNENQATHFVEGENWFIRGPFKTRVEAEIDSEKDHLHLLYRLTPHMVIQKTRDRWSQFYDAILKWDISLAPPLRYVPTGVTAAYTAEGGSVPNFYTRITWNPAPAKLQGVLGFEIDRRTVLPTPDKDWHAVRGIGATSERLPLETTSISVVSSTFTGHVAEFRVCAITSSGERVCSPAVRPH
jgi:hypothetical protein